MPYRPVRSDELQTLPLQLVHADRAYMSTAGTKLLGDAGLAK